MEILHQIADIFLHLDEHLEHVTAQYGLWTYIILFTIIFCETGLVVTPFLPGDSLLFAAGAIATKGSLNPHTMFALLTVAAIVGDSVNYSIGRWLGPKAFRNPDSRIFKKKYLDQTHAFYEKYGGKTIIIARFVPIVRTFAPFVAGVGAMTYSKFITFNVVGGILWVSLMVYAGYFFGSLPFVAENFEAVILGIIFVSILPAVIEVAKAKLEARKAS